MTEIPYRFRAAEQAADEAMERAADEISAQTVSLPDEIERSRSALARMIAHCDRRAAEAGDALKETVQHAKRRRIEAREVHKRLMEEISVEENAGREQWVKQIEDQERLAGAWRAAQRELEG